MKAGVCSEHSVHDTGSEDAVTEIVAGDHVDVGDDDPGVVKLAQDGHGAPVDDQGDDVTPGEHGGEVVEDVLVVIPVLDKHQSLIPKQETSGGDDNDHNFV